MKMYLAVSADKYEHIQFMENKLCDLSRKTGVSPLTISRNIKHNNNSGRTSYRFYKIESED